MSVIISPEERIKTYGIECTSSSGTDGILFRASTWLPGGEFIEKLTIKNVGVKVVKFKYKLPSTRFFSLAYPEEVILSPGIFKVVDVIFRPVEYEPYDDTIYIKILDGVPGHGFHVPVRATINKLILSCIREMDLGFCSTHQFTIKSFQLVNKGEVDAPFQWDLPAPFVLKPSSGIVPVGKFQEIVVSIMPEDASVYLSEAICHVGTGAHAIIPDPIIRITLSAKAKFANISLSSSEVCFDDVVSGVSPPAQRLVLRNTTKVPAEFSLVRFDADRDEVFNIHPKAGIVPAEGEVQVEVSYSALAMGCFSLDRYSFRTPGNCNAPLCCKGSTIAPKVTLFKEAAPKLKKPGGLVLTAEQERKVIETTKIMHGFTFYEAAPEFSLNFGDLEVGSVSTRVFYLRNDSIRDAVYSIMADENGTFHMHPKQGIIPALYKWWPVRVEFSPLRPMNYYRRFFVLVGDAMPLFYDCLGTGFIRAKGEVKEQRPAPLRHAHVQAYRNRSVQGLGLLSPDELDRMYDEEETDSSPYFAMVGKVGTRAFFTADDPRASTRTGEAVRTLVAPAHEFFLDDTSAANREVTINRTMLDFGFTPHMKESREKTVTIFNNTNSKVAVEWHIPTVGGMEKQNTKKQIHDDSSGEEHGHLQASKERELISSDREEKERAMLQAFAVSPQSSEINPGDSKTFEVIFCPKQTNRNYISELEAFVYFKNQRTFRLVNDYSLTPPWCLTAACIGHTFYTGQLLAKAQMLGGCLRRGKLVFPCGYVGETIYETFMLRNTSNLPCIFKIELGWEGQGTADDIFAVKPSIGEIAANDFTLVCARFSPRDIRNYIQLLRLTINGDQGGKLMLEGTGAVPYLTLPDLRVGDIKYAPDEAVWGATNRAATSIPRGPQGTFYLKPTCVGLSNTRTFVLKNASRLPLRFKVGFGGSSKSVVSVYPKTGLLKGNASFDLSISFAPRNSEMYEFILSIQVYPVGGKTQAVKDSNQPGPEDAPELLQSMTVRIMAQGETSAMIFDPPRTNAEVRLVNTTEQMAIFLENVSDSDLAYELRYKEEFEPDSASIDATRTVSEVMSILQQNDFNPSESTSASIALKFEHSLFCAKPSGILPARSRNRVVFTYTPRKAGLFEFLVYASIQAINPATHQPTMISNEEAALLRTTGDDRDFDTPFNSTMELTLNPLVTNITARAAFPKLLFEDIRAGDDLLVSDIDFLWRRFHLSQANYDLSIPMTQREVLLHESSTTNISHLVAYKFEFSPATLGSPVQTIFVQLRNNGYLPTEFRMHLPNEKQLDLEAWCDEEEPSAEQNRLICIIEELKLFTIEPRHATLLPGACCTLTLTYQHSSLKYMGEHNLPLRVFLSQGKQFVIDLVGRTIPAPHQTIGLNRQKSSTTLNSSASFSSIPSQNSKDKKQSYADLSDYLLLVGSEPGFIYRLSPVPIGLTPSLAPLQRIELMNVSGQTVQYQVDLSFIDKAVEENFNLPIIRIVNPSGKVPAWSSTYLECHFYPLEVKPYEFTLSIKYNVDTMVSSSSSMLLRQQSGLSTASSTGTTGVLQKRISTTNTSNPHVAGVPSFQYLNLTLLAEGYDPRRPKPAPKGSKYPGGLPPSMPLLQMPSQKITLSHDLLDFSVIPQHCTARCITVLRNTSSTTTCDFCVEEMSCDLLLDGLLSAKPMAGRISPLQCAVIEFSFRALCSPMCFQDRCKIIIRDIIKGSNRKQSSMKEALMKKINKRTVSTPHESVVSRPTTTRLYQVLELNETFDEGMKAKLPSTVNENGVVVASPTSRSKKGIGHFNLGDYGSIDPAPLTEFDAAAGTPLKSRGSTVGFTQFSSADRGTLSIKSPSASEAMSGRSSKPGFDGTRSVHSGFSGRSSTGRSTASQYMLGPPSVLIIRLKGDIYPVETVKNVIERNRTLRVLEQFTIPDTTSFIPPPGKKYFDPRFIAEQDILRTKGRINLSAIKDRDAELRDITHSIVSTLFKDVLNLHDVRSYCRSTLAGINTEAIDETERDRQLGGAIDETDPGGRQLSGNITYGLYFSEATPKKTVLQSFILELKHLGYAGIGASSDRPSPSRIPQQWLEAGDELLTRDHATFALDVDDFRAALERFNLNPIEVFIKRVDSVVEGVLNNNHNVEVVNVARYVKVLSEELRRTLSVGISKVKDKRTSRRKAGSSDGKKLHIEIEDSFNPVTSASLALKQEGFKDVTADVLGNLVIELMQDIATSKTFE